MVPGVASARRRHRAARRRWLTRGLWTVFVLGVLALVGLGVAYARTDVPEPNEIATAQASIVYYADGKTEMARLSDAEGNRESVPLSKVPDHMQKAMLAAEDQDFYQNNGISPTGIARAVWVAVKGGQATQGGSTITQQYVKNYFLTADRTLSRKAREILIAVKIDQQQTKDEILENYLNTIYYGRGAYGIQTAAKAYFNKDVSKLTPAESAFLASVIRGPSLYDPGLGEEQGANARERSGFILDAMVEKGWLSSAERAEATFPDTFVEYTPRKQSGHDRLHRRDGQERARLRKHKLTESDIDRGGLRIVSTVERPKQVAMVRTPSRRSARRRRRACTSAWPRSSPATARSSRSTAARTTPSGRRTRRPRTRCRPARRSRSSPSSRRCSPATSASSRATTGRARSTSRSSPTPRPTPRAARAAGSRTSATSPSARSTCAAPPAGRSTPSTPQLNIEAGPEERR